MPRLLGIDRRKMSKSYNNAIYLSDSPEEIKTKVSQMITDPQRERRNDPGDPDVSNVFSFHKVYSTHDQVSMINQECRRAGIGCVECKEMMAGKLSAYVLPYQEKRAYYLSHSAKVTEILSEGTAKAKNIACQTMEEVREAIKINY